MNSIRQNIMLAARNLLRQPRRMALALATVSGGVVAFLLAGGFIQWIFIDMRESTIHSQLGHIQITRPGYFREGLGDPYRYLLPVDTNRLGSASNDIRTVAPRLAFNGLISKGEDTVSFIGEGIDPVREAPISRAITVVAGTDLVEAGRDAVLLGEGLAANLDARPGDLVVLLATTADGGINAIELEVAGLFATVTKTYDDTVLRTSIEVARRLMRVDGATSWVVLLERTEATSSALSDLADHLPSSEFELVPWSELADFYNKTVELFSRQVGVVRALIALIIILSIANTLSMAVIERTGEIGTSMALGIRRRGILIQFLWEGALLGLAGGAIGVVVGYGVGALISLIGIPMPPPPAWRAGTSGRLRSRPDWHWTGSSWLSSRL